MLFIFCTSQSRSIANGNFLIESLHTAARFFEGSIHAHGNVTQIASALGLVRKLYHLTSYCGSSFMEIDFCLDHGLIRRVSFHPHQYRLLINEEIVHYFTLPDPPMTCVYNPANWAYSLEGWGETVDGPIEPFVSEYTHVPEAPLTTVYSNNFSLQEPDVHS